MASGSESSSFEMTFRMKMRWGLTDTTWRHRTEKPMAADDVFAWLGGYLVCQLIGGLFDLFCLTYWTCGTCLTCATCWCS